MTNKTTSYGMGAGLVLGLGLGAAIGLLFAPRKGEETREMIRQKTMETRDKVKQKMQAKTGKAKEKASEAASATNKIRSRLSESERPR